MATTSACAVGSLVRVTWLTPVAMTRSSLTMTAPNGPPSRPTFSKASSIACLRNGFAKILDYMIWDGRIAFLPPGRGLLGKLRFDQASADRVAHHTGGFVHAELLQDSAAVG